MFPEVFAQTTPTPAGDLLSGMDLLIKSTFRSAVDSIFHSNQYTLWVAFVTVIACWLFLINLASQFAKAMLSQREGILKGMILTTALMMMNMFVLINPRIVGEFIFSSFEFLLAVGNGFILGPVGQSLDLTGEIDKVVQAMVGAVGFDVMNVLYGLCWILVALATICLSVIYFVHLVIAFFYLYIVFPALLRFGLSGLFTKQTEGWVYGMLSLALEQMLIPLFGKLSIGLTFLLMEALFAKISEQQGGGVPGSQNVVNSLEVIMGFIFILTVGILLQLRVPTLAKIAGVSASGAARDIVGSSSGFGSILGAAFTAMGVAKAPITIPKGAISATKATISGGRASRQMFNSSVSTVRSKFAPVGPRPEQP